MGVEIYQRISWNALDIKEECRVENRWGSVTDYSADLDRRRSITGYAFLAGDCVISWKSSLQKVVALSTTEAEYISMTEAAKESMWLRG